MKMATGQNIRRLRLDRGWTLAQLSELSGVEVGTISSLEIQNSVRSKYFGAIAEAFGITVDELESGKPSPIKPCAHDPVLDDLAALPERESALLRAEIAARAAQARLEALRNKIEPDKPLPKHRQSA